jgi:hypothetical protein
MWVSNKLGVVFVAPCESSVSGQGAPLYAFRSLDASATEGWSQALDCWEDVVAELDSMAKAAVAGETDLTPEGWRALGEAELVRRIESAGFAVSGPADVRAAEDGEPIWVCNARAALAEITAQSLQQVQNAPLVAVPASVLATLTDAARSHVEQVEGLEEGSYCAEPDLPEMQRALKVADERIARAERGSGAFSRQSITDAINGFTIQLALRLHPALAPLANDNGEGFGLLTGFLSGKIYEAAMEWRRRHQTASEVNGATGPEVAELEAATKLARAQSELDAYEFGEGFELANPDNWDTEDPVRFRRTIELSRGPNDDRPLPVTFCVGFGRDGEVTEVLAKDDVRGLSFGHRGQTTSLSAQVCQKRYRVEVSGGGDLDNAPGVAVFEINEQSAREIVKLAELVRSNDLRRVERIDQRAEYLQHDPETDPEDADDAGDENSVRTECDALVVTEDEFHFTAYVKHTDIKVSCKEQSIAVLADHFGIPFESKLSISMTPAM